MKPIVKALFSSDSMKAGIRVMVGIAVLIERFVVQGDFGQQGEFFLLYLAEHEFPHRANGLIDRLLAG